jgi:beta-glucosidase
MKHVKNMELSLKLTFSKHRLGRVLLHLCCLARGGKISWHWAGVRRELFPCRRRILTVLATLFIATSGRIDATGETNAVISPAQPSTDAAVAARVEALLGRMTLDEKIGQTVLFTSSGTVTGPTGERSDLSDVIAKGNCGGIFNAHTVANIRRYQDLAVKKSRLGIPLLFGSDVIHGYKTIFPIPLGEAASWDLKAIETSARTAAIEASAGGLNWTFAPMVDIARDPRWGRIAEGAGEDPFLGSAIARARVLGFQGEHLGADTSSILACVKHFAAYGAAQAGRDYNIVDMSERTLREVYLPPYQAAIDAGAMSVMASFNEVNGIPVTANRYLLTHVLRDEWGFKGFVVSDYTGINELVKHGVAADEFIAGKEAMQAGVDMDMQGGVYLDYLKKMVDRGEISVAEVNQAARRILEVKFKLGLFDDPYRYCDEAREAALTYTPEHLQAAYQMACESLVLLKNSGGTLPLKPGGKIAVVGPLADAQADLLGTWSAEGYEYPTDSILTAMRKLNANGEVLYSKGCGVSSDDESGFESAVKTVETADTAVLVLGESADMSGEAASRTSISLPGAQTKLLERLKQTGKPLVVVLLNGRPLAIEKESTIADALLEAWHPGSKGAAAVADVLFGKCNPSGKLPVTFPRNLGQVPIYYSEKSTGRPFVPANPGEKYKSKYIDCPNDPLYPFGFGLSYTTFEYSKMRLDHKTLDSNGSVIASVEVTNTGDREGAEIVQLYLRTHSGSVTRPSLELKGFQRVALKPGERRDVQFRIGESDLIFLRGDMTWGTEAGPFEVLVGPNSRDLQSGQCVFTDAGTTGAQ